jgi:UTP---glucose-1-phosphate uridylyltransferase
MTTNDDELKSYIGKLNTKIDRAEGILAHVTACKSLPEQAFYLHNLQHVKNFLSKYPKVNRSLDKMVMEAKIALLSVIALEQGENLFQKQDLYIEESASFQEFSRLLAQVGAFYSAIGGVLGYHLKILKLMRAQILEEDDPNGYSIHEPPYIDIQENKSDIHLYTYFGLQALAEMAEIYAVGGAGDRLQLIDEKSKRPLPAARLAFCGRTLLEGLIRDLWAREYVYYKLYHKQITTPVLLMTSLEKKNDDEIHAICQEKGWFGRTKDSFLRIVQPLVPVVTIDGNWVMNGPLSLMMKPGGHGVIWKLAEDEGGLGWLKNKGKSFVLVRQINNPLAGQDNGLLALAGYGWELEKSFGFLSCPSKKGVSEGLLVLKEETGPENTNYCITNVEYTEFAKKSMQDHQQFAETSEEGMFPANTNILFAEIDSIEKALLELPIPGMLVNLKQVAVPETINVLAQAIPSARLESTMQNIADALVSQGSKLEKKLQAPDLQSFILLNERNKTISVTKKSFNGTSLAETPEGSFYDLMKAHHALLKNYCDFVLPRFPTQEEYLKNGPSFIFHYHPSMGPLYQIIQQKISKGKIDQDGELQLEIAEVFIRDLYIKGSAIIQAERVMGKKIQDKIEFTSEVGCCTLNNVKIINKGINKSSIDHYWKNNAKHHEAFNVCLEGESEFIAENVTFEGNWNIHVPHGIRAIAYMDPDGYAKIRREPLTSSWHYSYSFSDSREIILTKEERLTSLVNN